LAVHGYDNGVIKPILFALLCFIWGSTWLVIKVGYGELGPFTIAAVRFLVAGAILVPLVPLFGAPWPRGRTEWFLVVWVGVVLFGADYGLIYWGEQWLDSGLTAITFAILPVMTSVAAHFYLSTERLTAQTLVGTALAFAGVVALFADRLAIDRSQTWPMLAILASAACATAANLATKRHGRTLHPVSLNATAVLTGAAILFVAAYVAGEHVRFPTDAETWSAVLYLAVVGSVFTFLVYFWLLKTWSVTTLSFIAVFTPLVAVLLGFVFRAERPTPWTGLGGVLILGGATLALSKRESPGAVAASTHGTEQVL
jgi:drug/metabolite transporter (DMT)-like permease